MKLQNVVLPLNDLCVGGADVYCAEMYFHSRGGGVRFDEGDMLIASGEAVFFDTFFGGFFSEKWLRYTVLSSLWAEVTLCGEAVVTLCRSYVAADGSVATEAICALRTVQGTAPGTVRLEVERIQPGSMYYISIEAVTDVTLCGAYYGCDNDDDADEVNIAAAICTYRREQCVENTLAILDSECFKNRLSVLHGHLRVCIADNGGTLDSARLESEYVSIYRNKNAGGTGGFTRCMLEVMDNMPEITHILLMDDDAVTTIHALEVTFSFLRLLRPEHKDLSLGGALIRSDYPWLQYEAGARWHGGEMTTYGNGVDLRDCRALLDNSQRNEIIDFNGWWFTCIPIAAIRAVGLPLPLFLHRDDIEYGLRLRGRIAIPDGVGVWHETFERRMTGVSEYYDLRNMFIVNSIHCHKYQRSDYVAYIRKWYLRNIYSHRYNYIRMNMMGVCDALRGIDWLLNKEPEQLNDCIRGMDYRLESAEMLAASLGINDLPQRLAKQQEERFSPAAKSGGAAKKLRSVLTVLTECGMWIPFKKKPIVSLNPSPVWHYYRSGAVLHCDSHGRGFITVYDSAERRRCREMYRETLKRLLSSYEIACEVYGMRWREMTSEEFWRKYLEL